MQDINKKKKHIINVFLTEFIRIKGVLNWSIVSFIGFLLGMSSLNISKYIVPLEIFIISTFCILSFTFAINNHYDATSDRENPIKRRINAIASGRISKQTSLFLNTIFVITPLVTSFIYKFEVFLLCILFLVWMWIYSAPPIRLKGRSGIDIIWHFFAFLLLILWGSFIAGSINTINWLVAVSFGVFSCIAQIWNHIKDYSYDKNSGTKTYAVWVGLATAKKTLKIVVILHVIFLIPLLVLYSLNYYTTILILIAGAIVGIIGVKSNKDTLDPPIYIFPVIFGGAVYMSCIIYHISLLLDEPPINFLPFVGA